MKVTKRRTSYSIKLNPSEFEMLEALLAHAQPQAKGLLTGNAKRAFSLRNNKTNGELLRVDQDNSNKPKQTPPTTLRSVA